ncbi:GntR family transcriptional regulator [Kitasatospora sp. NPDC086791]|uniref:GntR family transcriptional regulator n=1 Tax=Kitasatospora sp. NPDC086791 TaxID=3155178 RepID=UPI003416AFCF
MADQESNTPKQKLTYEPWAQHELMASYLREGILNGDFPPGSKLPSTRLMQEKFGAAPQTIKNANDLLAKEGLAVSHRGSGIIVRPHQQQTLVPAETKAPAEPGQSYSWIAVAERKGRTAASELLSVEVVVPPADVRQALGLSTDGTAAERVQVLSLDGEPAELVRSYYPLDLAEGTPLLQKKKIKGGTPRLLADMGHLPERCVDRVSARMPTLDQFLVLKMPTREPILRTLRTVYDQSGKVIEVTVMAKAGNDYELQYEF